MVIKSRIYELLKQYLGEYLYGFEKDQLEVALLSGHIDLVNVNFKPPKVNELLLSLGLPLHLKAGLIGKLRFKYHYTSWLSNPLQLEIDELLLVFGPIITQSVEPAQDRLETFVSDEELSEDEPFDKLPLKDCIPSDEEPISLSKEKPVNVMKPNKNAFDSKQPQRTKPQRKFENTPKKPQNKFAFENKAKKVQLPADLPRNNPRRVPRNPRQNLPQSKPNTLNHTDNGNKTQHKEPPKETFFEKYISKVLKNLTLIVHKIHIRYEDETYPYQHPFAFGVNVDNLFVQTSNQEWEYSHTQEVNTHSAKRGETVKDCRVENLGVYINSMAGMLVPTSLWEETRKSPIGIFEAFPASEVRNLLLEEPEFIFKDKSATLVSPLNAQACLVLREDSSIKLSGFCREVSISYNSAMAECMRNFFEYFSNCQLWWTMKRYRPSERIPTFPRKHKESSKVAKKRSKVVRSWFQYAFRFIRAKRKLIEFIKQRREELKKLEEEEKRHHLAHNAPKKVHQENKPPQKSPEPKKPPEPRKSPEPKKEFSFLNMGRKRAKPGFAKKDLSQAVKEYNEALLLNTSQASDIPPPPPPKEPIEYFPKILRNSQITFKADSFNLTLIDDESGIEWFSQTQEAFLYLKYLLNEMWGTSSLGVVKSSIKDENSFYSLFELGKKAVTKTEYVTEHIFRKVQKQVVLEKAEKAFTTQFTYRPTQQLGDLHAYEFSGSLAKLNLSYVNASALHLLALFQSFQLDKAHKEHLSIQHIKKLQAKKSKVHNIAVLKRHVLTEKILEKLLEFQEGLRNKLKKLDFKIKPVTLSTYLEVGGVNLAINDQSSKKCEFFIPSGDLEFSKTKEHTKAMFWGYGCETKESLTDLYDYFSFIGTLFSEKYQELQSLMNLKPFTK